MGAASHRVTVLRPAAFLPFILYNRHNAHYLTFLLFYPFTFKHHWHRFPSLLKTWL